jgi:ABC-type uncharacterized transport system permease subunit
MEKLVKVLVAVGVGVMVRMLSMPDVTLPYPLGQVDLPAIVTRTAPVAPVILPR